MLERIRKFWNDLKEDKAKLEVGQRALAQNTRRLTDREADLDTRAAQLSASAARQFEREKELDASEATLSEQTQSIVGREAAFGAKILAVEQTSQRDREWLEIATKVQAREFYIEWGDARELRDDQTDRPVTGPLAERFATGRGPEWFERAVMIAKGMEDAANEIGITQERNIKRERELIRLLAKAGPILSHEAKVVAQEINSTIPMDPALAAAIQRQIDQGRGG